MYDGIVWVEGILRSVKPVYHLFTEIVVARSIEIVTACGRRVTFGGNCTIMRWEHADAFALGCYGCSESARKLADR